MENNHGKLKQILFEPALRVNSLTGEREITPFGCILWADENLNELIRKILGVIQVENTYFKQQYSIVFDPRYDPEFIKKEIEAEILCKVGDI